MTATDGDPEQGTGPLGEPSALTLGMRWRKVFPGEERQLRQLRRWLASLLPDCPARDDVACVATELGANAVRHTSSGLGGWFAVEITWHQPVVRIAVADCGATGEPRVINDPDGEHGRGLLVVQRLSVRTGVCGDHRGRLVWADVPWVDAGTAEPTSPQDPYEAVIRDGQAGLASRFGGIPAWFGRSTLQWWALADGELVAAASAPDLASLLARVLDSPPPRPRAAPNPADADAGKARPAGRQQRSGTPVPRSLPGHGQLPPGRYDATGSGGSGGPRTPPATWAKRQGLAGALVGGPGQPHAC